jgi:hypothetical protein
MSRTRFPRTLQEAFGPYTDSNVIEPAERRNRFYDLLIAVIAVAVLAAIAIGGTI